MTLSGWLVRAAIVLPTLLTPVLSSTLQLPLPASPSVLTYDTPDLDSIISNSTLLSLHKALVSTESITSNELTVGQLLVATLEAYNFTVTTQQVQDTDNTSLKRWNIYATPDPTYYDPEFLSTLQHQGQHQGHDASDRTQPKVLLTSHIDTVPPFIPYSLHYNSSTSSSDSHKFNRSNILIAGRGTVDAKACVAAMIQASLNLLSPHSATKVNPTDLSLLFVVGEETGGDGMRHFSSSHLYNHTSSNLRAVIFGEPTEGKLAVGHKGIAMVKVTARGKAAHSGYPWLGRSANSMILPALLALDGLGDRSEGEGGLPRSKLFGKSTVNIGRIEGGVAGNVVPEHAEAKVAMRLAGGKPEDVQRLVQNAVRRERYGDELELEFSGGYGPVVMDGGVDGFEEITVNYGTDVPNLEVGKGVKRYLYGPGSILVAHGRDEALTVGALEGAVKGYETLVRHALGL